MATAAVVRPNPAVPGDEVSQGGKLGHTGDWANQFWGVGWSETHQRAQSTVTQFGHRGTAAVGPRSGRRRRLGGRRGARRRGGGRCGGSWTGGWPKAAVVDGVPTEEGDGQCRLASGSSSRWPEARCGAPLEDKGGTLVAAAAGA
jgi:hypothetical protein